MLPVLNYHKKNAVVQDKVPLLNKKSGEASEVLVTIMQMVLLNGCTAFCVLL